ncbi:MAG TPA: NADH-quinone oxidoreductase subunit NuoB [Rhizobiales bacterium]|nr:NADH-quinone oxidoreductase subunit NuoB [Hyphomicrobiales bacterium]
MRTLLFRSIFEDTATTKAPDASEQALQELGRRVDKSSRKLLGHSLAIREVDAGSCNGCELEIHAIENAVYDVSRFGIRFAASPRHADVLLVTGPVTFNMKTALERTYAAMPAPKWVIAAGDCACNGCVFNDSYACAGSIDKVLPVDLHIPGCPPSPKDLLKGLLALMSV